MHNYTWRNTNFICSCIAGSIMRLFYFTKSRPRLLGTFPPIVANISCGALVSLNTATVIDISLQNTINIHNFFYLWSSRNCRKVLQGVFFCKGLRFFPLVIVSSFLDRIRFSTNLWLFKRWIVLSTESCPGDNAIVSRNTFPLNSDLSDE